MLEQGPLFVESDNFCACNWRPVCVGYRYTWYYVPKYLVTVFFRGAAISLLFLSTLSQPSATGAVFHGSGHTQRIVDNVIKGL